MKDNTTEQNLVLNRLYETARDYQFFKVNDKRKAQKISRRLNILKSEARSMGLDFDLSDIIN